MYDRKRNVPNGTRFVLAATVALACLAATAGCGSSSSGASGGGDPSAAKTVVIGTEGDYPPWNFTNPDGSLGGFDYELGNWLCQEAHLNCKWEKLSFAGLIPALQAGKIDAIMDDLVISSDRKKKIAFTVPYATTCITFAALSGSPAAAALDEVRNSGGQVNVESAEGRATISELRTALAGMSAGVDANGVEQTFAQQSLSGPVDVHTYPASAQRNVDLNNGRVDFILDAKTALVGFIKRTSGSKAVVSGPCFVGGATGDGVGVGVNKSNQELVTALNAAIVKAHEQGVTAKLSKPFFGFDISPASTN